MFFIIVAFAAGTTSRVERLLLRAHQETRDTLQQTINNAYRFTASASIYAIVAITH